MFIWVKTSLNSWQLCVIQKTALISNYFCIKTSLLIQLYMSNSEYPCIFILGETLSILDYQPLSSYYYPPIINQACLNTYITINVSILYLLLSFISYCSFLCFMSKLYKLSVFAFTLLSCA